MSYRERSTLLTVEEVAERLKVQPSTVARYLRRGDLPFIHLGRRNLVAEIDLVEFVEARKQRTQREQSE